MGSSKKANALQKERQAELKKKYFKTLGDLCTQLFGENVLLLLPTIYKDRIYISRFREFKFELHTNQLVDERLVSNLRQFIHELYYNVPCPYGPTQCILTQAQSDIYLFHFKSFVSAFNPESFATAPLFIEKTKSLHQIVLPVEAHIDHILNTMMVVCNYFHILSQYYVIGNMTYEEMPPLTEYEPVRIRFDFEWIKVHSRKFDIDGRVRPAFRLLNVYDQPELPPITITPAKLGMNTPFNNIPLEVYIQQHAIIRLYERLDVLPPFLINIAMITSLMSPETCFDSHGNRLVVIKYMKAKLGYLRVDLVEGCILIRTFLMFTQESTPEGEKIKQFAGFEKEDISYLKLDKISSFINLDFTENNRLVKLLKQCGLGDFIEAQSSIKAYVENNRNLHTSQLVETYMNARHEATVETEWG